MAELPLKMQNSYSLDLKRYNCHRAAVGRVRLVPFLRVYFCLIALTILTSRETAIIGIEFRTRCNTDCCADPRRRSWLRCASQHHMCPGNACGLRHNDLLHLADAISAWRSSISSCFANHLPALDGMQTISHRRHEVLSHLMLMFQHPAR